MDLKKLSDTGVEIIRANSGKKYYPELYLKPNTTIPNNIKIEPQIKDQYISLPFCSFRHPSLHLYDNSYYKTYEYLRDIIINKNIYLGYGVNISSMGLNLFSSHIDRYKNFERIEDVFKNIDQYSNNKSLESISNMPTNVPFFISDFILIRLDGYLKGSIEKDIKYWWDERYSNHPVFTKMKVFQNQYLFMT